MSEQNANPILSEAVRAGDLLFLSGQIGTDPASGKLAGSDIESQAQQVALNIAATLKKYGMGMENIIKANCYITDMENYSSFNTVYALHFVSRPARTCVAVKSLPFGALCEIEVVALDRRG